MLRYATLAAAAILSASGAAHAGLQGIVFTSQQERAVRFLDSSGVVSTLWSAPNPDSRLAGITRGPGGEFYVSDGRGSPFPNLTDAGIVRLDNLFSGAPTASFLTQGNPIQNPIGLTYDPTTSSLLSISTPGAPITPDTQRGIYSVSLGGGVSPIFVQDESATGVRFSTGRSIIADPFSNDYFVTAVNGGSFSSGQPDGTSSTLWRLEYDANTNSYNLGSNPLVDFADGFTGAGIDFTGVRGIATVPNSESLWVTDRVTGSILRIDLDGNGNFASLTQIATGLNEPEEIIYNPFTGQLVFSERGNNIDPKLSAINLDGTGYEILLTGEHARGFYIIPSPGAGAILVLSGLAAVRRRR
jgi:hypothetical protein